MSVREEDRRKNACSSRGLGLAAAAIGVGVGAAMYYFFSKRPENPDSEGSTNQNWRCEEPMALDSDEDSNEDQSDNYTTMSVHSTPDTSVHEENLADIDSILTISSFHDDDLEDGDLDDADCIDDYTTTSVHSTTDTSVYDDSIEITYSSEENNEDSILTISSFHEDDLEDGDLDDDDCIDDYNTMSVSSTTDTSAHDDSVEFSYSSEDNTTGDDDCIDDYYEHEDSDDDDSDVESETNFVGPENVFSSITRTLNLISSTLSSIAQHSNNTANEQTTQTTWAASHVTHIIDLASTLSAQQGMEITRAAIISLRDSLDGLALEIDRYPAQSRNESFDTISSAQQRIIKDSLDRLALEIDRYQAQSQNESFDTISNEELVIQEHVPFLHQLWRHGQRIFSPRPARQRSWSLEECSICFDIMLKDQQLMTLPCTHNFHVSCIGPWLQEHQTCPNCRKAAE